MSVSILKGRDPSELQMKNLGLIEKQVVKKSEEFTWNSFPNQFMVYTMQTLLFSVIQLKRIHYGTPVEMLSLGCSVLVLCLYPIFFYWLFMANVKPTEDLIMTDKQREVFATFKLDQKMMVLFNPVRKLVMISVVVFLQSQPVW